jgi:hypothetical protein
MIRSGDIKHILRYHVPVDRRMPVDQIHQIVAKNWNLTAEDKEPHPSEEARGSQYPKWKRKVQAVLHQLKLEERVEHFEASNEYVFNSLTFS